MEKLVSSGHLEMKDGKHYLTLAGKEAGGEFRMGPKYGSYFLWPQNFEISESRVKIYPKIRNQIQIPQIPQILQRQNDRAGII